MNDINLIYSGGSGGFLLLHLLLLSGRYTATFADSISVESIIETQWKVTDPNRWKANEFWPDNAGTLALETDLSKIYFYCNIDLVDITPNKLAVIYTDFYSQQILAYYKKANWYRDINRPAFNLKFSEYIKLLRTWREHYNNIKDPSWPDCLSFRQINRLPAAIQEEILSDSNTEYFLNYRYSESDLVDMHGVTVGQQSAEYIKSADIAVKLQDIVNSNGQVLVDAFNIPPITHKQQELISLWCSLHPKDLLDRIGISY